MTKDEPGTEDLCNIEREQIIQTFVQNNTGVLISS